jgi:hypothetical protein
MSKLTCAMKLLGVDSGEGCMLMPTPCRYVTSLSRKMAKPMIRAMATLATIRPYSTKFWPHDLLLIGLTRAA